MSDTETCPVCKENNTDRRKVGIFGGIVLETRGCDSCESQYEVEYGDPIKRVLEEA